MQNDTRVIFTASRKASEAADYLIKREPRSTMGEVEEPMKRNGDVPF